MWWQIDWPLPGSIVPSPRDPSFLPEWNSVDRIDWPATERNSDALCRVHSSQSESSRRESPVVAIVRRRSSFFSCERIVEIISCIPLSPPVAQPTAGVRCPRWTPGWFWRPLDRPLPIQKWPKLRRDDANSTGETDGAPRWFEKVLASERTNWRQLNYRDWFEVVPEACVEWHIQRRSSSSMTFVRLESISTNDRCTSSARAPLPIVDWRSPDRAMASMLSRESSARFHEGENTKDKHRDDR